MGTQESKKVRPAIVVKLGGSFCAFMIGAGYASGQEVLQYFTILVFLGTLFNVIPLYRLGGPADFLCDRCAEGETVFGMAL